MNAIDIFNIIISTFGLFAIWYLYFWLYKEYTTDCFRQNVFELRDKLFDEARGGLIDFNHPAYCLLRRTMNGTIRFSHKMSFMQLFFISVLCRSNEMKNNNFYFKNKFDSATSTVSAEVKNRLIEYRKELHRITFIHMVKESPFTFFLIILLLLVMSIPISIIVFFYRRLLYAVKSFYCAELDGMESTALAAGKL